MEKIDFAVGKERDFFDFISELDDKGKIAIISHNDLDGIVSAKVVNEVVKADIIKFVNYTDINEELVRDLKKSKVRKVIFTDLLIEKKEIVLGIEKFAKILIIDHHLISEDFNSKRTVFLNAQGYCAAYVSYYLFFKAQDISKFDWLVACACLSDWCYQKSTNWMTDVYQSYKEKFYLEPEKVRSGKFWNFQLVLSLFLIYFRNDIQKAYSMIGDKIKDLDKLKPYSLEVFREVQNSLKSFEKQKVKIDRGFFWEIRPKFPIKELVINILSMRKGDITFIIAERRDEFYFFSARRQDGKINVSDLLKELIKDLENSSAGGHFKAAGGHVLLKDATEFKKRVMKF